MIQFPQAILDLASEVSKNIGQGKELIDVKEYINSYDFSLVDFSSLAQYDSQSYKRTLLYTDQNVDVYLLGWNAKQGSKIHDHPDNGCVMRVIENELSEETYVQRSDGLEKVGYKNLKVGVTSHIKKNTILHKIFNESDIKSLSLHVYSPPNYKTRYYEMNGEEVQK